LNAGPSSAMSPRAAFYAALVGSLVLCAGFFAWTQLRLSGFVLVDDLVMTGTPILAGAACIQRGQREVGARHFWRLLGASYLSYALGMMYWDYRQLVGHVAGPLPFAGRPRRSRLDPARGRGAQLLAASHPTACTAAYARSSTGSSSRRRCCSRRGRWRSVRSSTRAASRRSPRSWASPIRRASWPCSRCYSYSRRARPTATIALPGWWPARSSASPASMSPYAKTCIEGTYYTGHPIDVLWDHRLLPGRDGGAQARIERAAYALGARAATLQRVQAGPAVRAGGRRWHGRSRNAAGRPSIRHGHDLDRLPGGHARAPPSVPGAARRAGAQPPSQDSLVLVARTAEEEVVERSTELEEISRLREAESRKVAELTELTRALDQANARIQQADRLKSRVPSPT